MDMTDADIETERLRDVADARADREDNPMEDAAPGTFYAHEALHMTAFLQNSFYDQVVMHPTVLRDPEYYRLAHKAHALMYELYQAIGDKHLDPAD